MANPVCSVGVVKLTSQSGRCEAQNRVTGILSFGADSAAAGLVHTGGLAGTLICLVLENNWLAGID